MTIRIRLLYGLVYGSYSSYRSGRPDSLKSSKSTNLIFFITTVQILGRETGYFLGPDYANTSTFKWWVEFLQTVASFFSLSTAASADNEEAVCPVDLDVYGQFYLGVVANSIWMLFSTGLVYCAYRYHL
eukprot:SAG22_NODE_37_length_26837_cov_8.103523_5_plen_129_part_00